MPLLSLHNHPKNVATLYTEDSDIISAARKVFELIQKPQYSAVAVFRPHTTLKKSWEIACSHRNIKFSFEDYMITPDGLYDCYNDSPDNFRENLNIVGENFGADFGIFAAFCQALGPNILSIRSKDEVNDETHIDEGYSFKEEDFYTVKSPLSLKKSSLLPYGVTVTMAVKGGGSQIHDAENHRFSRDFENGKHIWEWKENSITSEENIWDTSDGTILIMRSRKWDKNRKPMPHNSPARVLDGDPQERIVGVSWIYSR